MSSGSEGLNTSEQIEAEEGRDKLFEEWKDALDLPESFPQPIPPALPNVNEMLSAGSHERWVMDQKTDIQYTNYKLVETARIVTHYQSGYSFIVSPEGQGSTTIAKTVDTMDASSELACMYIPVLIKEDALLAAENESSEELKARVMSEILKRAVVAQQEVSKNVFVPPGEDENFPYGYTTPVTVRRSDFLEKGIIDEQYNVDLDKALEELGGVSGIFSGLSDYFKGFSVRIDFSSELSREDPIKYGLYVARLFSAANDLLQELVNEGVIERRGEGALLQGIGPKRALDAITEIADLDIKVINEQKELNVFSAWKMLLESYPEHKDEIGRYINSELMGKSVKSGEKLPVTEIFKRFEQALKVALKNNPDSLHLGFK